MESTARTAALNRAGEWAARARQVRYECRRTLRSGEATLLDIINRSRSEDLVGRVKLLWILESLPGAGKVTTRRRLASLGIDEGTPLNRLDEPTLEILLTEFSPSSSDESTSSGSEPERTN